MARRRGSVDETDPLDLLLDTVSNVFGGVMFLTLLAALLVIGRGTRDSTNKQSDAPPIPESDVDARLVELETRQVEQALQIQQRVLINLDVAPEDIESASQVETIDHQIAALQVRKQTLDKELANVENTLRVDQKVQQALEVELSKIESELKEKTQSLDAKKVAGHRSIVFRPLRVSDSAEAVVVLRYRRVYLFRNNPLHDDFNRDDFFVIEGAGTSLSITPKPHRGIAAQPDSLSLLVGKLRSSFPPASFKITIAVYDDSFGQFNPLVDALTAVGYNYRTIACTSDSELSFGQTGPTFVQ